LKTHLINSDVSAENCEASIRDYAYKLYRHCSHLPRVPPAAEVGRLSGPPAGSPAPGANQADRCSEAPEVHPLGDLAGRVAHTLKMKDPG
jgi:hypothetical protein